MDPSQRSRQTVDETPALRMPLEKARDTDQKVAENINDPIHNPMRTTQRTVQAAKTVVSERADHRRGPHSAKAQRIVFIKGAFDVFLSLSLIFFPSLLYDGPLPRFISTITPLTLNHWEIDSPSAYALSALIMGAGICGISAAESTSDDAYKVVATLNGVFAAMGLLGCVLAPQKFGSPFLLLACLQDVFWFYAIVTAGNYGVLDTLGLSWTAIGQEAHKLLKKDEEEMAAKERRGNNQPMKNDEHGVSYEDAARNDFGDFKTTKIN